MSRRATAAALAVCAVLHLGVGVAEGLQDGDFSLLQIGVPLAVATGAAAALVRLGRRSADVVAVGVTLVVAVVSLLLVPLYLLGVFHAPQALVALGLASTVRGRA